MPFKDIDDKRRYQREWMAKRRQDWIDEHGPCVKCGSDVDMEVDHIDPDLKLSHKVWSWSKERREAELAKCQVLCGNHHKEKTSQYRARVLTHGHVSMYRRGCRCAACKEATRIEKADWRAATGRH